jgi:hypothetical protein
MASWASGTKDCWYLIDLKAVASTSVFGETAVGTYYSVDKGVDSSACVASGTAPGTATTPETDGYPAG